MRVLPWSGAGLPDPEALVIAVFSCLAVSVVSSHHPLAARLLSHQAGVGVDVTVTPANGPVPLSPDTGLRTRLRPVTARPVVRQLHPLHAVLHHQVAEIDVGPGVSAADHVGVLVTVVLTTGQT